MDRKELEIVYRAIEKHADSFSNVGFVLARVLDAMRELEQGGDAICV